MNLKCALFLFSASWLSCSSEEPELVEPIEQLNSDFYTLGLKWGNQQVFSPSGLNIPGPETPGGTVSYSFGKVNTVLETEIESGIKSVSYSEMIACAKDEIRNALNSWSEICQIEFNEYPEGSDSDIKFYAAPMKVIAIAAPPTYKGFDGGDISGEVVFRPNQYYTCHEFYLIALHEIGHVLGLGHVEDGNVMNSGFPDESLEGLQVGDINGAQTIYGKN